MIDISKYLTWIIGSVGFIILYSIINIGYDVWKFRSILKRLDRIEQLIRRKVSK
jgi:hypothetical protein